MLSKGRAFFIPVVTQEKVNRKMAIDIEAIRKKFQQLTTGRQSNVQLWKPVASEYKVRGLPWPNGLTPEGSPFIERWFYYIGQERGFVAPFQFGKPDPIHELKNKLYASGKADDKILAKNLQPKMRAYMPLIVRGEEDKGVQVYSFSNNVYKRLLSFWLDEEVGDILDTNSGYDLKIVFSASAKQVDGRSFLDATIDPARKPSPLHADTEIVKKWIAGVPNLDDMFPLKSKQEVETILNNWLNGDSSTENSKEETNRGGNSELDKIAEDVKAETKPAKAKTTKKEEKPVAEAKQPAKGGKSALDEAFDDLTND